MKKKEFKVGEVFQFGLFKLRCEKSKKDGTCVGCFFLNYSDCNTEFVGDCIAVRREDNTSVIFVEVEE